MNEKPAYYAIIPASVRYDKKCSAAARLLFGEISALTSKEGYCWAENQYFADLYEVDASTASAWVSQLVNQGHIRIEVDIAHGNKRKIWLCEARGVTGKSRRGAHEKPETSPGKAGDPSPEKAGHISTSSIITPIVEGAGALGLKLTDAFWAEYSARCNGKKPTYRVQFTKQREDLVKLHGLDACLKCVTAYFANEFWFTENRAWSFAGFVRHFDEVLAWTTGANGTNGKKSEYLAVNGGRLATLFGQAK